MNGITVYRDPDVDVQVIDGPPPDVAQLTADLATRTQERDDALADAAAKQTKLDAIAVKAQAAKDRDAAISEGQDILDIIGS